VESSTLFQSQGLDLVGESLKGENADVKNTHCSPPNLAFLQLHILKVSSGKLA